MKDYLPTPKMAAVLWTVLTVVVIIGIGDWLDILDLRPVAAAILTGVMGFAGGWARSEPKDDTLPEDE